MTSIPLAAFLRNHRAMHLADAENPLPSAFLERLQRGQRLALVQGGHVVGAVVPMEDLQLLELADHGLTLAEDPNP